MTVSKQRTKFETIKYEEYLSVIVQINEELRKILKKKKGGGCGMKINANRTRVMKTSNQNEKIKTVIGSKDK